MGAFLRLKSLQAVRNPALRVGFFCLEARMTASNDDELFPSQRGEQPVEDHSQAAPTPESAPNFFSPTFEAAKQDGSLDDLSWASQIDKSTKAIEKGTTLRGGLLGDIGVADPSDTSRILDDRQAALNESKNGPLGWSDYVPNILQGARAYFQSSEGIGPGVMAPLNPVKLIQNFAPNLSKGMESDREKSLKKEQDAIDAVRANPNRGVTSDNLAGWTRNVVDSGVTSVADIPIQMVESIGIGAAIGGWGVGATPKIEDNSIQATARWATAKAREYFPGDTVRQEDFATKLVQGIGSTAGFWGVHQGVLAMKLASPAMAAADSAEAILQAKRAEFTAMAITATVGAMSEAPGQYRDAQKSRADGRDVSDLALMWTFIGGLALGSTEALPIAKNIPLPAVQKSKMLAYLQSIVREGGEEGLQEFGQAIGEDVVAKYLHDPDRTIGDDAMQNALVGFLSGGGITAARLAKSSTARQEALHESGFGRAPAIQQAPAAPARGAQPAAPDPKAFALDLNKYDAGDGTYPAPQAVPGFDASAELAGSARPKNGVPNTDTGASAQQAAPLPPPTFAEMTAALPLDAEGSPDQSVFQDLAESLTGKRYWNQLSDLERETVVRALESGETPETLAAAQAAESSQTPTRIPFNSVRAARAATQAPQGATGTAAQTQATGQPQSAPATDPRLPQVQREVSAADDAEVLSRARAGAYYAPNSELQRFDLTTADEHDRALRALDREIEDKTAELTEAKAASSSASPGRARRAADLAFAQARKELEALGAFNGSEPMGW
jgi:hypothetical protein